MIKNKCTKNGLSAFAFNLVILLSLNISTVLASSTSDPSASGYSGKKGITLFVSKSGDNSDGSSWKKGFHSIQSALSAIPDDKGGHTIIIRPDTYVEANLYPVYKGAAAGYNLVVGDTDGHLGSGSTGRIIIDAGDPGKGFKSYDWINLWPSQLFDFMAIPKPN